MKSVEDGCCVSFFAPSCMTTFLCASKVRKLLAAFVKARSGVGRVSLLLQTVGRARWIKQHFMLHDPKCLRGEHFLVKRFFPRT
mmetsp:Transcript_14170/g.23166  ORF Transcript_14170/g.23166 Transcript_14170/m.23166 type:complete len:84 (+) Transcript_14170:231-482(+)